jgi:hypothetical protein
MDRETQKVRPRFAGALFKVDEISGFELDMLRMAMSDHSASGGEYLDMETGRMSTYSGIRRRFLWFTLQASLKE